MKECKLKEIKSGDLFACDVNFTPCILIKTGSYSTMNSTMIHGFDVLNNLDHSFDCETIVNKHWWEAIAGKENIPTWILLRAYLEGAKIDFKGSILNDWCRCIIPSWHKDVSYRITPPKKYKIKIDDKEIEISEESYNKLKTSLMEN